MSQTNLSRPFLLLGLALFLLVVNIRPASLQAEVAPGRVLNWQSVPHLPTTDSQPPLSQPIAPDILVPGSQIVFQSFRDLEDWDLYRMNSDSSGETAILSNNEYEFDPRFKPGLDLIAYTGEGEFNYDIFTMNPTGTGIDRLTENEADDVNPAWSPDGSKIAYQSYQDGQAEIYMMNADGSGKTRLTFDSSYDGMPAWSPDGNKIAFSSGRNGVYRIYTINSNGSGLTQFSTQPFSFFPEWAPDGSKIAFSADGDGDGWLEIWTMNNNGSDPQVIVNPQGTTDALTGSWSPDSNYVAYTHLDYIYYQGNWYWTEAHLRAYENSSQDLYTLSSDNTAWEPDWQTNDTTIPVSAVNPLPPLAPGLFTLSWSGSDPGGSGISSYDIQMKVGNGNWTDLLIQTTATSVQVSGTSGQVLSFRSRARDYASHLEEWPAVPDATTTIDNLPPNTAVTPLPTYSQNFGFSVSWYGNDPGGSQIVYDVQYRSNGGWQEWLTATPDTSATFYGTSGVIYYFRVRGRDDAQNQEEWPAGNDGDASTTLYEWQIYGTAHNNTGSPVSGTQATITPGGFATVANDPAGQYAAYSASNEDSYTVAWQKNNYQTLPQTQFYRVNPFYFSRLQDIWMPPIDNLIQDWGLESGGFNNGWGSTGNVPAGVITQTHHTGQYNLQLGQPSPFAPVQAISPQPQTSRNQALLIDNTNTVHVAGISYQEQPQRTLWYTQKPQNGSWSSIEVIDDGSFIGDVKLVIDNTNRLHSMWIGYTGQFNPTIMYSTKMGNGTWSSPTEIYTQSSDYGLEIGVDGNGVVHAVWPTNNSMVMYTRRATNGVWSTPTEIGQINYYGYTSLELVVTPQGVVHVLWQLQTQFEEIQYRRRELNGNWTPVQTVNEGMEEVRAIDAEMVVDSAGFVHVVWTQVKIGNEANLVHRSNGQSGWSTPLILTSELPYDSLTTLLIDANDTLHIIRGYPTVHYIRYEPNGGVYVTNNVLSTLPGFHSNYANMIVDSTGTPHIIVGVRRTNFNGRSDLYYTTYLPEGFWSIPQNISAELSGINEDENIRLAVDNSGKIYITWDDLTSSDSPGLVYYTARDFAETSGEVAVSQMVTIPVTMTQATLSFLYQLVGASSADTRFEVTVDDGSGVTTLFSTSQNSSDWEHNWVSLANWAGETVTISLMLHQTAGRPVPQLYVDEVTLGSGHPDLWVGLDTRPGLPNQQTQLTLIYGNQGGYPAGNNQLTLTLPPGLSFTSATTPPTAINGQTITWDLGNIPAGSGPTTIIVTVHVAPTAPFFNNLASQLTISTTSTELETANNTITGQTFIGYLSYLPTIAWP